MGPMRPTAELRVPMVPVAVEIAGVHGAPAPCEVYVPDTPRVGRTAMADDLAALLEADPPFIPVKSISGVSLVGKHSIQWLAFGTQLWPVVDGGHFREPSPHSRPREHPQGLTLCASSRERPWSLGSTGAGGRSSSTCRPGRGSRSG